MMRARAIPVLLLAAAGWQIGGCSSGSIANPFRSNYDAPPTAANMRASFFADAPRRTVIVIGRFENPKKSPLNWKDIGPGVSDALSRTLLNDRRFDIRINDALATRIAAIISRERSDRESMLLEARRTYSDVDFVITGRVTDFHHTAELPVEVSRRGFFAPKNEALVAIDLNIVDLRTGRVAVADHVHGMAKAPDRPTSELYENIAFGSYTFWSTPLGNASHKAIENTIRRLTVLVPSKVAEASVIRQRGWRELEISGGTEHGIQKGQRYYLCVRDDSSGALLPVLDEVMGTELVAQITRADRLRSVAWVLGEAPPNVNLGQAVLLRQIPRDARQPALAQQAPGSAE